MIDKINELEKEILEELDEMGYRELQFIILRLGMIKSVLEMNLDRKDV